MEREFSEVIITSIRLKSSIAEKYLVESQKKSGYDFEVFFELLKLEIQGLKKKYSPFYPISERMKSSDYLEPEWHGKTLATISSEYDLIFNDLSFLERTIEGLFEQEGPTHLENKWNELPIEDVQSFFSKLVIKKNKKGENWMTSEEFELFLRRSFGEELDLKKPEINMGKGTKGIIIQLFYEFYEYNLKHNSYATRDKSPFVKLLEEAFNTKIFYGLNIDNFNDKADWNWT
jgi:hypothetical protein